MSLRRFPPSLGLGVVLAFWPQALGQPAAPRLGYIYPAGGRQSSVLQVVAGGQYLDGVTNAYASGSGVQAKVVDFSKPMPPGQFNILRDKLTELQNKKQAARRAARRGAGPSTNTWTAADEKMLVETREKILKNPPNRNATPAIAETVTLQLTISTNAEPGEREVRLRTPLGLSNPIRFCVGQLSEFSQPAAKPANPNVDRLRERLGLPSSSAPAKSELRLTLPAVVNGQIMPGGVERYRFTARQGARLVIAASAQALIPYLADAVPGWFQATLALYDAKGKELAYADDYGFHPDPVLCCEIPKDGEYVLHVRDAIYRGREDFVYRLTVGELPFVTSVFPLGGLADYPTTVQLTGWNLPATRLDLPAQPPGLHAVFVRKNEHVSNHVPFAVDALPDVLEQEPNNREASAQRVAPPVIVNGRVDQADDWDVFSLEGLAGRQIIAEVQARRLDSPLDSVLKLTDAAGRELAFNDDSEDKGAGLTTHQADSRLCAVLPANGVYYLHLGEAQRRGGPEYGYRLRISPPQPDFALRVVPSSINVRPGASVPLTVFALRRDGFTNEIRLALRNAPSGFTLNGARIPANQDQVRLTLTAPFGPREEPFSLSLEGRATLQGQQVARLAVPAEDMMQAFAYRHLVPSKELLACVAGRAGPSAGVRVLGEGPVRIPAGGMARVRVAAPGRARADNLRLELSDPPEGITLQELSPSGQGLEMVLQSDSAKVKPGLQGNLLVAAFTSGMAAPGRPQGGPRRAPLGFLPAIPFEIVSP